VTSQSSHIVDRSAFARLRGLLTRRAGARLRSGSLALVDQVVLSAANLATGVILGRACSKEEFGLYTLAMSIVLFAAAFQGALILTPYMIFSPRLRGMDKARYAGSTLIHQACLSAAAMAVLALGGVVLTLGIGPRELAPVVWALAAVVGLLLFRDYARQLSFANLSVQAALWLDTAAAALQLAGIAVLVACGTLSAYGACWVIGAASGLGTAGWLLATRGQFAVRRRAVMADLRHNWTTGKWVFVSGIVWALGTYLYPWLLLALHGSASAGVWAACFGMVALANPLILGVQNYLGPSIAHAFAQGGFGPLRRHTLGAALVMAAMFLPLFGILTAAGSPGVVLLYGEKYAGCGVIVAWLALSTLVATLTFPFSRALFAAGMARVDFGATVVSLATLATAGLWLVRGYGVAGAGLGLLLGNAAGLAVRLAYFLGRVRPRASVCEATTSCRTADHLSRPLPVLPEIAGCRPESAAAQGVAP